MAAAVLALREKGGIDLNPEPANSDIATHTNAIKFQMDPAMLQQLQNAVGFEPEIIGMQPLKDLRVFLEI